MPYFCSTERGLLLLCYDKPLLVLRPDGWQPLADLPRARSPASAAVFQGRIHIAYERGMARLEEDGRVTEWPVEEAARPHALVSVGDRLLLLADDGKWRGTWDLYRVDDPGRAERTPVPREITSLLSGARLGSAPWRDEALVAGSGGVVALRPDGASVVWRSERPVLDAVRLQGGALMTLDSLEGVHRLDPGGTGAWVRPPRTRGTSTWTDADGEPETEQDDGELGILLRPWPLVTYTYCGDRRLVRRAHDEPVRAWPAPPQHGIFLVDLVCHEGRLWAMADRGGYRVMEAVDDGDPQYVTARLPERPPRK